MQVNFLVCGVQKAGTTALDGYCRRHPELCMADEKEPHFFDDDALFQQAMPDYHAYHQAFTRAPNCRLYGEATPIYMYWPEAPARIHHYNPGMRLIVLLRHPGERAYSHWQMETGRGLETLPFSQAIRTEAARLAASPAQYRRIWSYVDRGHYLAQLRRLWALFGRDQVLVLQSEWLRHSPGQQLSAVSDFLGIAPFPPVAELSLNTQVYRAPMSAADRQYLGAVFEADIAGLEQELGWDLEHWRM